MRALLPSGPVGVAAALLVVEGAALTLLGLGLGAAGFVGEPDDRTFTVLEAAMVVVLGVGVLLLARALAHTRRWSRSPAVTVQLLALPVGVGLAQNDAWVLAAVVLGLAGAVLYQLASPPARLAFDRRP